MDSFSVSGNTQWPTDSRILLKFLQRAYHIGLKITPEIRIAGLHKGLYSAVVERIEKLEF